jgi:hypothetical protein
MSKKSFVLHIDSLQVVEELSDEQAGKLLKAIYNYQIGADDELDLVTKVCFLPFRNQFIRDAVKYEETVERNKINGSKGGRPTIQDKSKKTEENPNNPLGYSETQLNRTKPKKADNDSDSDSDFILKEKFENFRKLYLGTKGGLDKEFTNFKKKHKDWKEVVGKLETSLLAEINWRKNKVGFVPEWKNLQTWLNQRCWEQEFEAMTPPKKELVEIPASYIFNNVKIDYGNNG